MMRIPAWFSDAYAPIEVPLLARLGVTHDALVRRGMITARAPAPVPLAVLQGLHDAAYLDAFLQGTEPLASRQGIAWSARIRAATLAMLGGQLQGASEALARGTVVMNIARGFHHAHPAAGSGFCPINGLALVAHAMPRVRVMVLDCDEHGGNGTEEFAARLPNLHAISLFGTRFGCRGGVRSHAFRITHAEGFARYLEALEEAAELIEAVRPDVLLYQAGADCHADDPKSLLRLGTRDLFRRDVFVFRMARRLRLPTLFVVAGGYQSAERVARINVNTVRAARLVWGAAAA